MFEVPERFNAGTLVDRNLEAGRGAKVAIRTATGPLTIEDARTEAEAVSSNFRKYCRGRSLRRLNASVSLRSRRALWVSFS